MTDTRVPLITMFIMITAPIVSYAYMVFFTRTIKLKCEFGNFTEAGKKIYGSLKIDVPMYIIPGALSLTVTSENIMFSTVKTQKMIVNLNRGKKSVSIPFVSDICGVTRITVENIECRDLMCLFNRGVKFSYSNDITVYPAQIRLEAMYSHDFLKEHEGAVYDVRKRGRDTSEILNIRDYVYGDNVRNIHWKLSSKLNKPVIREFARPNNLNVIIFCDLSLIAGETKIEAEKVSNNLAIMSAISKSMIEKGIEHTVCVMDSGMSDMAAVENMSDYVKMIVELMNVKLSDKPFDAAGAFINLGLCDKFTKVIYIAREYSNTGIHLIASRCDLTLVLTNDGEDNILEKYDTYKIISLGENDLYDNVHKIMI
jgi:hypothetical protein